MLDSQDVAFFEDNGFLHIPEVFTPEETQELSDELDRLVAEWALTSPGWEGNWRNIYMDPEVAKQSKLTAMHDLQFYSETWFRGITNPRLVDAASALIGPNVELHHSTLHIKPPQSGHPFPMHQDSPFYPHRAKGFVDVLVHLDDTNEENGEIRFLAGSHKQGALEHLTAEGVYYYLPPDDYRLTDTVPVCEEGRCRGLPPVDGAPVLYPPDQSAAAAGADWIQGSVEPSGRRPKLWDLYA